MEGWLVGWVAGWKGGWLDGWLVGWVADWMDGWLDGLHHAYGGNSNNRNVSCSKPSLHFHKGPWEGALYKWLTRSASDAVHVTLCK